LNMIDYEMDPQQALDAPRFCILDGSGTSDGVVAIEEGIDLSSSITRTNNVTSAPGISEETVMELQKMGHNVKVLRGVFDRASFGRGQIIWRHPLTGVMWSGSDPRCDGMAIARA